jgi:hypothetical protein
VRLKPLLPGAVAQASTVDSGCIGLVYISGLGQFECHHLPYMPHRGRNVLVSDDDLADNGLPPRSYKVRRIILRTVQHDSGADGQTRDPDWRRPFLCGQ